tara:strand:- start:45185 stop:45664 length:480 start_codon:yes stop_codon:yes gene_type:complete
MSELASIKSTVFADTFALLSPGMDSLPARAMLLTIGLQESRFEYRKQIGGPAHGFWQFEAGGGVKGVLSHTQTRAPIAHVCAARGVNPTVTDCYNAIINDDILACAFARLLLYTVPGRLPNQDERNKGWAQYIDGWRPGAPHRHTWDAFYDQAWREVIT